MADVLLRNDKEWSAIDGELCRVRVFTEDVPRAVEFSAALL
jgi:hypothetical protein